MPEIETYHVGNGSGYSPNSRLPVLVYRNVLSNKMTSPEVPEEEKREHIKTMLGKNSWEAEVCRMMLSLANDY